MCWGWTDVTFAERQPAVRLTTNMILCLHVHKVPEAVEYPQRFVWKLKLLIILAGYFFFPFTNFSVPLVLTADGLCLSAKSWSRLLTSWLSAVIAARRAAQSWESRAWVQRLTGKLTDERNFNLFHSFSSSSCFGWRWLTSSAFFPCDGLRFETCQGKHTCVSPQLILILQWRKWLKDVRMQIKLTWYEWWEF